MNHNNTLQRTLSRRQRGISLIGMLFIAFVVAIAGLMAVRLIPVGIEYMSVSKAATSATRGKSVAEVRELFDKSLQADQISQITSKDMEVTREGERVVVNFAYDRTQHLFGPAYLLLKLSAGRSE